MASKKVVWGVIIGVIVLLLAIAAMGGINSLGVKDGSYDEFAQCLTDAGAKMYGAYWCPHCASQKDLFGSSWKNVNYIECSLPNRGGQTAECNAAGIQSYPTWEFSNGQRISGVLALEQLSQITGCSLESSQ